MAIMKKENINVWVDRRLATAFRVAAKGYFNRLGMCFGAAMLMFLETDPQTQGEYLKRVFQAEIDDEVDELLATARENQGRKIRKLVTRPAGLSSTSGKSVGRKKLSADRGLKAN